MSKKIKKLMISAEKGGFRCPKPNEIEKQSITIKSNGQVWWNVTRTLTIEEQKKGFSNNGVKITEYKNIGKKKAEEILIRAEEVLKNNIDTKFKTLICDACPDEIYIMYEDNEVLFGQLIDLTDSLDEIEAFYDYLSEELLIENLLFFDN